ncbi:hypothetical protein NLI96_g1532 [Meripilus lineatus]|uniref:Major facilitator superfamily (MFS) profile domain-containing protein n=1 Tax=Meripilus lineatus TaxID=2056292 RepID=A0AAD5YKV0_9APHY|nr:hypothetical protein NLI96_g1532 [Physisporinus lineatus]
MDPPMTVGKQFQDDAKSAGSGSVELEKHSEVIGHTTDQDYDLQKLQVNERRALAKIDFRVVPVLCILYLLAFLDRVNIANAALFGLKEDLKLGGTEYNTALVIFFVPYVGLPRIIVASWPRDFSWVREDLTKKPLFPTHELLGLFESGMFPGCFYLLAMWYRREEAQKRYTFFFCSTTLAGAFGGLLASAIGKMDGIRGYRGWRWVFILEGLLTCVVSFVLFFLIADFPEQVKWLSAEEKRWVKRRLYDDVGNSQVDNSITFRSSLDVLKDYKVLVGGLMYFGLIVPAYGYAYFAPAIIQGLGYGPIRTQLLSVPPWAAAFGLAMCLATISDAVRHRFIFTIIPPAIGLAGFVILMKENHNIHLRYAAIFLAAAGTYAAMPIIVCWFNTNLAGHRRRAVATGWQVGFGNIGGIIAAYSFLAKDAPRYITGYSICIAFICLSMLSCGVYFLGLVWENRQRDRGQVRGVDLPPEEKEKMGDLNPDYRYLL